MIIKTNLLLKIILSTYIFICHAKACRAKYSIINDVMDTLFSNITCIHFMFIEIILLMFSCYDYHYYFLGLWL